MRTVLALILLVLPLSGHAREIFVDQKHPEAKDTNPATEAAPLKTIQAAVDLAQPGDTIWIKAGDYEDNIVIRKAGTPMQPITISAWKDDRVQWGYRPRPLPVAGDWRPIAGTKSFQVTLTADMPADFVPLLSDKPLITFMQDAPPKDDKPNWGAYRKSDRTLMFNSGGKDPAALGKWTYSRRPSTYSFLAFVEPAAWWVIRHIEFSWQGGGMYMCGDHCLVEDCFFTHCYREGIFLHGRMDTIRRCNFYRCGSAVVSSGAGTAHILEDNLLVECGLAPEDDFLIVDIPGCVPEGYGPTVFKGNNLSMMFYDNTVSDTFNGAGWYADCANVEGCRIVGNAFWDNPGGGIYNEALANDTMTQGNLFYRNGATSSVATRWNIIENLFYESGVAWCNLDLFPQRGGYMLLRRNAFVCPTSPYLQHFGTAWGQTAYPEVFRQCMVDWNRVWANQGTTLIVDGGTGTKYNALAGIRKEFGWEIHGEVKPYNHETVEQAAAAMGGSVVTYRVPWGRHAGEARPMLANADLQGVWPAAAVSADGGSTPAFFWRIADGNYDANPLWGEYGRLVYHEFWHAFTSNAIHGECNGCRWFVDTEQKYPADIMEKMPSHKGNLHEWDWTVVYGNGNRWLALEGLHPDKMLPQGTGFWSPLLGAAPDAKITVSFKIRGKGLISSEKGSPVVWLEFTGETGQNRRRAFVVGRDDGGVMHHPELVKADYNWTDVSETVTAPEGAVRMALFLGILPCQGQVNFDDININTASEGGPAVAGEILAPRLPLQKFRESFYVDLSKVANRALADDADNDGIGGWSDQGPDCDMRALKTGERRFGGVQFKILPPPRSVVVLRSSNRSPGSLPEKVSVRVGRKADLLFFLHSAAWFSGFKYVVHYADRKKVELPVTTANMADWIASPVVRFPDETDTFTTVAETVPEPRYGRGSIYRMEWSAPADRRAVPIDSIEFVGDGKTVPILLGITGVRSW
jgi:hypothetical protein